MTIAGHHTVAELREWLVDLDFQINKVREAYAAFQPTWIARDRAAVEDWGNDWNLFYARYGAARNAARSKITEAGYFAIPDSILPVEDEWQAVHRALRKAPDGPYEKGDLQDLYNRLAEARGAHIDMSKMPQPQATDVDLNVFNGAGAVLNVPSTVVQAGKEAWKALPSPKIPEPSTGTKVLLGGGILLGLALVARSVTR